MSLLQLATTIGFWTAAILLIFTAVGVVAVAFLVLCVFVHGVYIGTRNSAHNGLLDRLGNPGSRAKVARSTSGNEHICSPEEQSSH